MIVPPIPFDLAKLKWQWFDVPAEVRQEILYGAENGLLHCVKSTDRRATCRYGKYFLKIDWSHRLKDRLFPAARNEYQAAIALAQADISTVKHFGWARASGCSMLVTEAWQDDAVSVLDYWYRNFVFQHHDPDTFLNEFACMLRELINKPIRHGDFHLGNILYSPKMHQFTLVDLHNVSIGNYLSNNGKLEMLHVLGELRMGIRPGKLTDLFWKIADMDQDTAAIALRAMLANDLARARHEWPRRSRQLLNGYPKLSQYLDFNGQTLLVRRNHLRENLFDPSAFQLGGYRTIRLDFPTALEMFLFSFWLSMLLIPHVPAAALAPNGTLYFPKIKGCAITPKDYELVNEFNEYLLCMHLNLEDGNTWLKLNDDRLIISDYTAILMSLPTAYRVAVPPANPASWRAESGEW